MTALKRDPITGCFLPGPNPRKKTIAKGTNKIKRDIIKYLEDKNLYHPTTELIIDQLMSCVVTSDALTKKVRESMKDGTLIIDKTKLNPAIDGQKKMASEILNYVKVLAMTPQDRLKLKLTVPDIDENEMDNFMNES